MTRLDGTVALVTGASSGIGAATVASLAAQGATVVLVARRVDRMEEVAGKVTADGGTAFVIEADVREQSQAEDAVGRAVEKFGRLDILVNNAGQMLLGPIENAPVEQWERMIDLNVKGLLYCANAALPHLITAASGDPRKVADMVNISSVAGRFARLNSGVYNLTKFGVNAFSESLRQEMTEKHVRISLVEPGAVATELVSHNTPEAIESLQSAWGDMQRMESEDIADAITYIVTRPAHVAVNELLIRPTEQQR